MHIITTDSKIYTIKNLPWNSKCKALVRFSRLFFFLSLNINLSSYHCKVLILVIFLAAYILYISLHLAENKTTFSSSKCLNAISSTLPTLIIWKGRMAWEHDTARIQAINWCAYSTLCALPQSVPLPLNTITETTHITPSFKYGWRNQKGNKKEYNSLIMKKTNYNAILNLKRIKWCHFSIKNLNC